MKVVTVDCDYLFPQFAAAYLRVEGREAAFIDNNTFHSVPRLLSALEREGLRPADVRYVIITHVHLDHAGGTSRLMEACPNATLLAHPRAAKHMIDPSRLVASARHVYGDENFKKLYGQIDPVDASRVRAMNDGEKIQLGRATFEFLHTRGHANHHFCVLDSEADTIFTGDAFGLRYPALQTNGLFIFPSTSPTDFDPGEARRSIERIAATGVSSAYPTHFGEVRGLKEAAAQLKLQIDFSEDLLERAVTSSVADAELDAFCERQIQAHYRQYLDSRDIRLGASEWAMLELDLRLNGQGIAHVARKRRHPEAS